MRRRLRAVAAPFLLAIGITGYTTLAVQGLAAQAVTSPTGPYQMYGNDCNNGPCGMRFTATSNPNNAAYRAYVICLNGTTTVGGWHTGTGIQSATGECGASTEAEYGEVQWNKTNPSFKICWSRPGSWNGSC